jgi:hypothetical protein
MSLNKSEKLREILLHYHPNPINVSIDDKIAIVLKIIELTQDDPAQGSKAWASERQIGGSDTSSVMGRGYYGKGFFDVVRDKIFGSCFNGNLATRFGRVMEEVSRLFIEKIFTTTVWELKSLPNQLVYTSYSPDGVTVAQLFGKMLMLLLEFKTPLSRIPDGKIPKEYLPQIKAGMCAMPMVDGSLFVNTMLRICNLKDIKYNYEYNTILHKSDCKVTQSNKIPHKSKIDQVVAFGLMVLVQNEIQYKNALENAEDEIDPILVELGLTEGRVVNSHGKIFITFDDGVSFEDNLLRKKSLSIDKTLENIYRTANIRKADPNLTEDKNFSAAMLYENEVDYGFEGENSIDTILNHVDNKLMLGCYHLPPYIVTENLGRIDLFKSQGISPAKIDPVAITAEVRKYFIDAMDNIRNAFKEQNVRIVGFVPYKIFKMDFIYQPNTEPDFIKNLKPQIDKYADIKKKCNEVDADNQLNDEEKNSRKWEILYEFFPEKKPADVENNKNDLLSKIDEDSMF